jgi:hypothetical protein
MPFNASGFSTTFELGGTIGTSDLDLSGASYAVDLLGTGFPATFPAIGAGQDTLTLSFGIYHLGAGEWEEVRGVYTHGTTTLARTTVERSSTGSKVDFSAGTVRVYVGPTGARWDELKAALDLVETLKTRYVSLELNTDTALTAGDGKRYWRVPDDIDGHNLVSVALARVSGTGVPSVGVHNVTQSGVAMLTTNVSIDSGQTDSSTATAPVEIDTANDDVAAGDRLRFDVDAAGTDTLWCEVQLGFQLP